MEKAINLKGNYLEELKKLDDPKNVAYLNNLIKEQGQNSQDYHYSAKDQAILRTGLASLKDADCWGSWVGLLTSAVVFGTAVAKFPLKIGFKPHSGRRILMAAAIFSGSIPYYLLTDSEYSKYNGTAAKVNLRISQELSQMMDLK
jgi:hypothetical protein